MTKEQIAKINACLVGVYNLSPAAKEPYFSKSPCKCCKSTLFGNKYEFTGIAGTAHTNELVKFSCCVDCFEYLFT